MFMFVHIKVTQDITTGVIPLEAVRIPLPKRPHTMINDFIYLLGYVFSFLNPFMSPEQKEHYSIHRLLKNYIQIIRLCSPEQVLQNFLSK